MSGKKRQATVSVSTDDEITKPPTKSYKATKKQSSFSMDDILQRLDIMNKTMSTLCTKDNLETALTNFEHKMLEQFETKLEKVESDMMDVRNENDILKKQLGDAKTELSDCHDDKIKKLETRLEKNEEHSIRNEQYSRRSNIRISGLPETPGTEDSTQLVIDFFQKKLGVFDILPYDIDAAHRVPIKDKTKPKPVIVKFIHRAKRDKVIKTRSKLKGSGITIQEDLTSENQKLLLRASSHPSVLSAWTHNGKILAKFKDSNVIREISRHTDINELAKLQLNSQ